MAMNRFRISCSRSRRVGGEVPPSDQVVRRRGEAEDPIDEASAAVAQAPQQADGLHPAEG